MANNWFQFKHFKINQDKTAMKVGVDSVLLGSIASFNKPQRILDIGSGTGILAFMAEQRTGAQIYAVEIEENAYNQCIENITLNNKAEKILAFHLSFQEFCNSTDLQFSHIISNPPFFDNSTKPKTVSGAVAKHTDYLSFDELVSGVVQLLAADGKFSIIIPFDSYDKFSKIAELKSLKIFKEIIIYPKENMKPNRLILEFSFKNLKPFKDKLCIREVKTNNYTREYVDLTNEFYLNLNK